MKIHIPNDCKEIHVLMSGGADSTALLYQLAKQTDLPIYSHSILCKRTSGSSVDRILGMIEAQTQRVIHRVKYGSEKQRNMLVRKAVELIQSIYSGGYVFTGCNLVPDISVFPKDTRLPIRGDGANERHLRPFIDILKPAILEIYLHEGILDLLAMTKSCGSPGPSRCNRCFFCLERQWAADMIGISDRSALYPYK